MEIVLEPVEQQMPRRRGRRRRFRRLMIDKETFIKNAVFSVQRHHYGDTMRTSVSSTPRLLADSLELLKIFLELYNINNNTMYY